jgi:hypothetical protein
VFEGLLTIMQQMGDLKNYDVTITQTGEGFGNINYTILPTFPPVALTPEEASLPRYDISDISKALTVEQIEKLMAGATMEQILGTDAPSEPQTNESPAPSQSVQLGGQVSFN